LSDRAVFDVVVVGGGAAGCVVAARVAGSGSRSVLLVEAGPDLRANTPELVRDGWHMTREFDWGYSSEPDEFGVVQKVRRVKMLGGTSAITRFAVRGSPADYEEWVALGNPGWGFQNLLPYFKRLETDLDYGGQPWHGVSGPIPIGRYRDHEPTDIHAAGLRALEATGFPIIDDHNRPRALGAGPMPMSSRDGIRVSTAGGYLPSGRTLENLTIRSDVEVSHVVLEGTRAAGVSLADGTQIDAACVVLCAGTYGSPAILMRSGIGPAEHLRAVGVPVKLDLPGVGANLADHPGVDLDCGYRGPARETPLLHTIATFHSSGTNTSAPPDLMFWLSDPVPPEEPEQFTIGVVLLKPRSTGTVRLRSADPSDAPLIDLPHLTEHQDMDRLVEGYRRAREVASRPEIRRLCEGQLPPEIRDDGELRRMIQQSAYSIPHVVGTCSMGSSADEAAVVDASGRVYGAERLYVVDASIMPRVPSGFTHLPTIAIAEKLAENVATLLNGGVLEDR
jgi:choline dehydrogenase-like flavoprotein